MTKVTNMNVSAFETSVYILVITQICILMESQNLEEIRWPYSLIVISLSLSLFFFFFCHAVWHVGGIVVPQPGIEPGPPALGAWSLKHWNSREVPLVVVSCLNLLTIP